MRRRLLRQRRNGGVRAASDWGPRGGRREMRLKRRRAIRLARLALVLVVGCGLVGWGLWWIGRLPALRLTRVHVRGVKVLREAEVLGRARLRPGDSLIGPDLWRAARRIRRLPAVKSVAMDRDLPGGVIIRVKERTPREYVAAQGGVIYIDAERVAFAAKGPAIAGVVEIAGVPMNDVRPGQCVRGDRIESVLAALDTLRSRKLAVRRIAMDGDELKVMLCGGALVWLGPSEGVAARADGLRQAITEIKRRGERAVTIDLRDPDRIVWRSASPGAGG